MKSSGSKCPFSLEERIKIIREYESNNLSLSEMSAKYGINSPNTIANWRARIFGKNLSYSQKNRTFAARIATKSIEEAEMKEKTRVELEAEIKRLRNELENARLQNLALNTMIDIAEEQGIRIRKKSGAKQ